MTFTETGFVCPPMPAPDLAAVFRQVLGENLVPGRGGFVVAPTQSLVDGKVFDLATGPIDPAGLIGLPHPVLTGSGLTVARYRASTGAVDPGLLVVLRSALVAEAQAVLVAAARKCHEFLASRRSGGLKLSTHPVVAHQVAGAVAVVESLRHADVTAALSTSAGRAWLVSTVDEAAASLGKLVGGRALLAGNLVALRAVLLTVNRIYLGGDPCTP